MKTQLLLIAIVSSLFAFSATGFSQTGNGKKMGVAVNPVLALFEWGSGEVNFWNIDKNAEINIPIQFTHNPFFVDDDNTDVTYFSTGVNYRRFFSEKQKGFFLQAGWKFDYGTASDGFESASGSAHSLLFGMGFRVISKNGVFWGAGINIGRMWGSLKEANGEIARGSGPTLDIDLFKFGYAW